MSPRCPIWVISGHSDIRNESLLSGQSGHSVSIAEALQHHDRRSFSTDPDVDGRSIGFYLFGMEIWWK